MVLLNEEGRMVTMRQEPRLALIRCDWAQGGRGFQLQADGMPVLVIHPRESLEDGEKIETFK